MSEKREGEEGNPRQIRLLKDSFELLEENIAHGQDLVHTERRNDFSRVQRLVGVGSWKYDVVKDEFYGTEEVFRIYGVEPAEFGNDVNNMISLAHPHDQVKLKDVFQKQLEGVSWEEEFRILMPDGSLKYVIGKGEPILGKSGQVVFVLGTLQDVTEKRRLEKELEDKQKEIDDIQRRYQVLIRESCDVFEILSADGTILYMSDASERVIGYRPEERVGRKVYEYYDGDEQRKVKEMIQSALTEKNKRVQGDVVFKTKFGKELYLQVHLQNLLHEPAVKGLVVNFRDITSRVEMEKRLVHLSTHDALTGLPNRLYFEDKLEELCRHAKGTNTRFAVMLLDIERFKYVTHALGYLLGDKFIVEIAKRLKSHIDHEDFLCRYSEDRFAIIVQGCTVLEQYERMAESIIRLFNESFTVDRYALDATVSIGVSIYGEDGQDARLLIKDAEIALFLAKSDGHNSYKIYSSDVSIHNYRQFELRNDLRKAIDNHQLRVCYQPIINLRTKEILAAEALLRWEHPAWGVVLPGEFMPLAEESAFIIDIGDWLFKEVCSDYRRWLDIGLPKTKVSVNFSSMQFFEQNFVVKITDAMNEYSLEPRFLIMEITESMLMIRADRASSNIKRLQSMGIQVALDDFGTGFSSLAYLNAFNIDIIKIDSSFIKDICTDKTCRIITRTIINMAKDLGIKIVAEGIENYEQLAHLQSLKCHTGQGYMFSRPIPSEDFVSVLARKRCGP